MNAFQKAPISGSPDAKPRNLGSPFLPGVKLRHADQEGW